MYRGGIHMDTVNLIDLGDISVYVRITRCFRYLSSYEGIRSIYRILKFYPKYGYGVQIKPINISVINSLTYKIGEYESQISEQDSYILYAGEKFKQHKGWSEDDLFRLGMPDDSLGLTLLELIELYNFISQAQDLYSDISKEISIEWASVKDYVVDIESIKNTLESTLAMSLVSAYSRK
jgi:hypothetical protein